MLPVNPKKILIVAGILLLIVGSAILWWYTGGICIEHYGGFNRAHEKIFEDIDMFQENFDSYIGIEGKENTFGIPFVIMVMPLDSPPYHIKLQLRDKTQTLRKMIIETVEVEYDDGEKTQERVNVIEEFTAEEISMWDNNQKAKKIPVMWLDCKLCSVVEKNKSCTVKMEGFFINAAEEKIPFNTSTYFDYEPVYWWVYTFTGIDIISPD